MLIVQKARIADTAPGFIKKTKLTGAQYRGILYERKAQKKLAEKYGENYLPSPWVQYTKPKSGRVYWCQPDGLLILPEMARIVIVEIKYQHTEKAKKQLFELYLPVVKVLFADFWDIRCCEVVKWFDPAGKADTNIVKRHSVHDSMMGAWNVHILNKGT